MPAIVREGQRVVFDELGRSGARVVVLAHNLLAHRGSFAAVAARLATRARVVNVDLRGHGDSHGTVRAFSTADLAADLAAVLGTLAARDAIVVGTSLGAAAAVELARARPELVGALVLIAANPYAASARDRLTFGALATILRTLGPRPVLTSILAGLHAPDAAADVRGATTAHLQAMDRRDMARAVHAWASRPPCSTTSAASACPRAWSSAAPTRRRSRPPGVSWPTGSAPICARSPAPATRSRRSARPRSRRSSRSCSPRHVFDNMSCAKCFEGHALQNMSLRYVPPARPRRAGRDPVAGAHQVGGGSGAPTWKRGAPVA
ncbi:alpha/beta fold hydrolase [Nannocystis pusilla]|uniref:alpha/beta fold hydrolase n=1 Tax=Nannocystis pusilla TaxID=889268 RepID=UPI003B79BDEB